MTELNIWFGSSFNPLIETYYHKQYSKINCWTYDNINKLFDDTLLQNIDEDVFINPKLRPVSKALVRAIVLYRFGGIWIEKNVKFDSINNSKTVLHELYQNNNDCSLSTNIITTNKKNLSLWLDMINNIEELITIQNMYNKSYVDQNKLLDSVHNKVWIEWANINPDNDYITTQNINISNKTIIRKFDSNYVVNGYVLIRGNEDEVIDYFEQNDTKQNKKHTEFSNYKNNNFNENDWKEFLNENTSEIDIDNTQFNTQFNTEDTIKSNPSVGRYVDFTLDTAEISNGIGLQTNPQIKQKPEGISDYKNKKIIFVPIEKRSFKQILGGW